VKIIIDTDLARVPGATVVDNITSATISDEDPNFPATNLRDDFTTNICRSTSNTAVLTAQLSKGEAILLINTNATSAVVTAGSGEAYANEAGFSNEAGYSYLADEVSVTTIYRLPGYNGRLWAEYPEFAGVHTVTIALSADSPVTAGILRGGKTETFRDMGYGFNEGSDDYSIEMEMNNGANYFRKRNVVRNWDSLQMLESKASAYKFKHDIFDMVGPKPLAILMSSKVADDKFVVFAKRTEPPTISPASLGWWNINYSLKEVI